MAFICTSCHPRSCKALSCDFNIYMNLSLGTCEKCRRTRRCVDHRGTAKSPISSTTGTPIR